MSSQATVKEFVYNQNCSKDEEKQKILVIRFVRAVGDSLTQILQDGGQVGQQIGTIREDKHELNLGELLYVYTQQEAEDKPLDLLKIPQGLEGDEAFRIGFAQRKLTVNMTETTKRRKELRAQEKIVSTPVPTPTHTPTPTPTSTTTSSPKRASARPPSNRTAIVPEPTAVSKVKLLEPSLGPIAISKNARASVNKGGSGTKRAPLKKRANLSLMGATGGKATGQLNSFRNRSLPPSKNTPTPSQKDNSNEVQPADSVGKESEQQAHPNQVSTPTNDPQNQQTQDVSKAANLKNSTQQDIVSAQKNQSQDQFKKPNLSEGNVAIAKIQATQNFQSASKNLLQEQDKKFSQCDNVKNQLDLNVGKIQSIEQLKKSQVVANQQIQSDQDRQNVGKSFTHTHYNKHNVNERNAASVKNQHNQSLHHVGRIQSPTQFQQIQPDKISAEKQKSQENQLGGFGSVVFPNSVSKTPENSDFRKSAENSQHFNKNSKISLKKPTQNFQNNNNNNNTLSQKIQNSNNSNGSNRPQIREQQLPNSSDNNINAHNNNNNNLIDDFVAPLIAKLPEEKKTTVQLKSSSARKIPQKPASPIVPDFNHLRTFLTAVDSKQFELAVLSMLFAVGSRGLSLQEIYEPLQTHYFSKFNIKYERLVLEDLLRKHSKYNHSNFRYALIHESKIKFESDYLRELSRGSIPKEFVYESPVFQMSPAVQVAQNGHAENLKNVRENSNSFQKDRYCTNAQEKQFQQESPKTIVQESSSQGEGQSSSQAAVKNNNKRQFVDQQQQQQQQQQQRSSGSADGLPPKKLKLVFKKEVPKEVLESGELPPTQYQDERIMKNNGRRGVASDGGGIIQHESLIAGSDDSQPDQLSYESKSKKRRLDEVPRKEVEGSTAVVLPQLLLPDQHLYERYCSVSNLASFIQPSPIATRDEFLSRRRKFAEEYDVYSELYRCFEKAKEILKKLKADEKQSSIVEFMEKYEPYLEKVDVALCCLEKKLLPERSQLLCYYELIIKPGS